MVSFGVEPKRGAQVGQVLAKVLLQNVDDVRRAERGELPAEAVRSLTVEALVDTGATFFCLPAESVRALGLPFNRNRDSQTVAGPMTLRVFGGARIDVLGRSCDLEVMELPEGRQTLLGQIPLEAMDFWVDVVHQRLIGNPEHNGQWMAEVY